MFEPFERAMDTTQSGIEGIGLGMSITIKLIDALNGKIKVKSELEKGTTFEIIIPMECSAETIDSDIKTELSDYEIVYYEEETDNFTDKLRTACQTCPKGKVAIIHSYDISEYLKTIKELDITKIYLEPVFNSDIINTKSTQEELHTIISIPGNKKVLIADDNQINLSIVCDYLEDMGITAETVMNGQEAYQKIISDNSFDLMLMDIRMPVIDGYEATKMIRAYGKAYTNNIPIVAMTANAFEEDIALAKQSGMNEHMSKPIEFDKFVSVIMNYLS